MITAVDDAVTRRAAKSKSQKKSCFYMFSNRRLNKGFLSFVLVKLVIKEFTGSCVQWKRTRDLPET